MMAAVVLAGGESRRMGRPKATRVTPNCSASSTASELGAPTAAMSGMPAAIAFCTIS